MGANGAHLRFRTSHKLSAGHIRITCPMRSASPSPGYRPCVGIAVINADGLVWVGRRADAGGEEEGRGQWWQMPQGGIDAGEDPADAALRELIEETGMRTVEIVGETDGG